MTFFCQLNIQESLGRVFCNWKFYTNYSCCCVQRNLKPYQYVEAIYVCVCSHRRIVAVCCYQEIQVLHYNTLLTVIQFICFFVNLINSSH